MAQSTRNHNNSGNGTRWSHEVLPGAEQRPPKNINVHNDLVYCTFTKHIGRGMQTQYCNKPMEICRLKVLCPYEPTHCMACSEIIFPQTQFIAICRRANDHTNGKPNIICCKCLEMNSKINVRVPKIGRGRKARNKELWHIKKDCLRRKY